MIMTLDAIISAILKTIELFYDPKKRHPRQPEASLCQNIVKVYLLLCDFVLCLDELTSLLTIDLSPILNLNPIKQEARHDRGLDRLLSGNKMSSSEIADLISHVASYDDDKADVVRQVVLAFNSLNQLRDEILGLVTRTVPVDRIGILFPELARGLLEMALINTPLPLETLRASEITRALRRYDLRQLAAMKAGFQEPFLGAINARNKKQWQSYLMEVNQAKMSLKEVADGLKEFIQANCTLADIL